jgi:hypothetical protein
MIPLVSHGEQATGVLKTELKYAGTHDLADYHGIVLKIYEIDTVILTQKIDSLSENPFNISLQMGHKYKIEVYANGMFANVTYVEIQKDSDNLLIYIPITGSVRFMALYNDGYTPIIGATVMVKSKDGTYQYWTNSTTDDAGTSIRYWLQPTIVEDQNYVATFTVDNNLSYSYSTVRVLPGQSIDVKVVIPWAPSLGPLNVLVYKSPSEKVSKSDGVFTIKLYDFKGNKIDQSPVDVRGHAEFSDLKVGSYFFRAVDNVNNMDIEWGSSKVVLDGKQDTVQIFKAKYVPSWIKKTSKFVSEGEITEQDLDNAIMYLYEKAIIT